MTDKSDGNASRSKLHCPECGGILIRNFYDDLGQPTKRSECLKCGHAGLTVAFQAAARSEEQQR